MSYIAREIQDNVYKSFRVPYITAVLGPRRVGKSTLVSAYMNEHSHLIWVKLNMDVLIERQRCAKDELQALIQERSLCLLGKEKTLWVAIDEAQKCPELFDQIKVMYDKFKDQRFGLKFILTGSGSLSLHQLSAETLSGRIEIFYLREFSLREIAFLENNIEVPKISILDQAINNPDNLPLILETLNPYKSILEQSLKKHLIWGGLPEIFLLKNNDKNDIITYLGNYLQTYLEKDVRAIQEIAHLNVYQQLLEIVASQTGSIREDRKILESLGCSREKLKKYRGYLIATLVYEEIYPFIGSSLKRLVKSPKGFLNNNGLISFLTGMDDFDTLKKTGLMCHRFENWCLHALNTWLDKSVGQHHIYYWRTSGGVEVDFIIDKKPFIYPFEVTMNTQKDLKKIKHIKKFMDSEGQVKQGFYIYNGPYDFDSNLKIHFLPAWSVC